MNGSIEKLGRQRQEWHDRYMHILFVHHNFPAQFGQIAGYLSKLEGFTCTFLSQRPAHKSGKLQLIQYNTQTAAKALEQANLVQGNSEGKASHSTHYCSRTFENGVWNAHAVYQTMKAHPQIRPDLIVGHSGAGSTVFLADLYECPIINYFEYYYHRHNSDMDFRPEFPCSELDFLRARARNAMILLDLETCRRGYSPTNWQRSLLPAAYQHKVDTIFDGIDRSFWRRSQVPRRIGNQDIPDDVKIVTYVARGFESMRGFDIFMKVAKRIYSVRSDVIFAVVGSDQTFYGNDSAHIPEGMSFRQFVLSQDDYDLNRFIFPAADRGSVPVTELVQILSLSDLHIYLTVPFVLSWSLMNAMACSCTVLASNTPPVAEVITHEQNGLLADFYDIDELTRQALRVLDSPDQFAPLGQAATQTIDDKYSLKVTLPQMLSLYQRTLRNQS